MRSNLFLLLSLLLPAASLAQAPGASAVAESWNDPRTLDLIRRGIERRSVEVVDSALRTYTAEARGFVYFLLDAPELGRQSLVRTDQVAVDVYWRAPNQIRQRIVGLREQQELPVRRLYYYLDRLTVVQDNYGQAIVIADGDNVSDVPHPVGVGALAIYDYRLADSLTLRLPGAPDPVRVREIHVRPRDSSLAAVVGSIFLDEGTGALVRMSFTFTPAAYVDPRLDYINVTLENGLWQGRFWLPHEQRLEIRREMPEFDLPFGTVIRTRMRIGGYRFNEPLADLIFAGSMPIVTAPAAQRQAFPFEQPIDAEWSLEEIDRPPSVGELRREARALARQRAMSGLPLARPGVAAASDLFRFNRAEGAVLGAGVGLRPGAGIAGRVQGGWAFGPGHPVGQVDLAGGDGIRFGISAFGNLPAEVGGARAASGVANTLGALLFADDWTDPYLRSGLAATVSVPLQPVWSLEAGARLERQRSAALTTTFSLFGHTDSFRPVGAIDAGDLFSLSVGLRRQRPSLPGGVWGEIRSEVGRLASPDSDLRFGRIEMEAGAAWTRPQRRAVLELEGRAGMAFGSLPRQQLFLVGGRGSLPGFDHRRFGGDRYFVTRALASADLARPWLRGRLLSGLGWTGAGSAASGALQRWDAVPSRSLRPTVGVGLGIFYDLVHLDVARGLGPDGRGQLIVEARPTFWGWM